MKNAMNSNSQQSKRSKPIQTSTQKSRPEIRDNIDSRANEEQDWKGTDTTHNKREVHSKGKKA
ncbi:hypothetical protein GWC95_09175 [Sediminibacterium roseum]|uniref:Uncharacterized protein n=1 Tax=Sediminibacterium roseum TaxID=1978412 RepID=A0ABW9ZUP9_9BACT|nr:hypothetical protein [Sediminibacterium roseum]NCI50092.1 hypothetical protein [Sediminibacterium roseum]